jgi:hypothetical protein
MTRFWRAAVGPASIAAAVMVAAASPLAGRETEARQAPAQQPSARSPSAQPPARQPDFEKVRIKTTPVGGKVYLLEGQGGNIAVSAGIDAGKSLEEIQRAGLSPEWKDWAAGFRTHDHWIESVYRSLRQERE